MTSIVKPEILKSWLHDGAEIALFDVREFGQFSNSHILLAGNLPYSRLELDIERLAPRRTVRIVLCDDGRSDVALRAAARLEEHGYADVWILDGGTDAWVSAGYKLFGGVNVPSKTFGELIEQCHHTPQIAALDLVKMKENGEDVVILDGRPFAEYQQMNIPGASCCPNGELPYRIRQLVPNESTKIVINCAGRTRSLIGAQTLINFGVKNQVFALENGTQGWFLADLPLSYGSQHCYPDIDESADLLAGQQAAESLATRFDVPTVAAETIGLWLKDDDRTLFLFDVRTQDEFQAGSLPGARHAPGGQLVQATDEFVGVRNARVVLFDSENIRAKVTASWLKQMGWQVYVLAEGMNAKLPTALQRQSESASLPMIECEALADGLSKGTLAAFDLRSSMEFRSLHVEKSVWAIRPSIVQAAKNVSIPIVLIANEIGVARVAREDLVAAGMTDVRILEGGFEAWREQGLLTESTPNIPPYWDCIDYLFFEHQLQESKDAARRYLTWEVDLISQLDRQERSIFQLRA